MFSVRAYNNYDRVEVSDAAAFAAPDDEVSKTVQADKADADINVIVKRWLKTGQVPASARLPTYGDFTGPADYQQALNVVEEADFAFAQLPAELRDRFGNDPAEYVEFCSDPANRDEMIELGLLDRPSKVDNVVEPVTPPSGVSQTPPASSQA